MHISYQYNITTLKALHEIEVDVLIATNVCRRNGFRELRAHGAYRSAPNGRTCFHITLILSRSLHSARRPAAVGHPLHRT